MTDSPAGFAYELVRVASDCDARRGRLQTPHGLVDTPAFMPVGTLGTVKGLDVERVAQTGAQMVLANTYHLALRPGAEVVAELGGLHAMMGWGGPILTDSGGFQVFSLASRAQVSEQGVVFRSHIDGAPIELTPEGSIRIQQALGSDLIMAFDQVPALPNTPEVIAEATWRSVRWAERCRRAAADHKDQMLLGIVQGGLDPQLRRECARQLCALDFAGYAIGGLSVGETPAEMVDAIAATTPHLPSDRPRYLMGVGRPEDLLAGIGRGIDLFDCVMPTRNGRNALAFTDRGRVRLRNAKHERDLRPLDPDCQCLACCRHSRGYLRHLFQAKEMLGPILATLHNLTYYQRLMNQAREAIEADDFEAFCREKERRWSGGG
jgi:queuine tRNA-ribosyltransferase